MTKELATTLRSVSKMVFLVLFGLFFMFGEVLGATIFEDNFDNYNLGILAGQGGWEICPSPYAQGWNVSNEQYFEGGKSAKDSSVYPTKTCNRKQGNQLESGEVYFTLYAPQQITQGAPVEFAIFKYNNPPFYYNGIVLFFQANKTLYYYNYQTAQQVYLCDYDLGQWERYGISWNISTKNFKFKCLDKSVETDWITMNVSFPSYFDTVYFINPNGSNVQFFIDKISAISPEITCGMIGHCDLCDFYGCLANSDKCCWNIDQCLEGACYIGGGTCGSGSNLFFCETQESCESYGGSWWLGSCGGYEQPYLPPQESCEDLGTIEKWLCEIKNLLKGIFVPSTEKTEELRQTIDAIKQKFPMNYLSGASGFFDSVKTNVNSSSGIDFKILGKSGSVNFAFWEKTTEIGGEVQTIGEIIKVFITFLIVLGFVFWAISFGKRVF